MNEEKLNNLINQIKDEKMTSIEKALVKNKVMSFVNNNPIQKTTKKINSSNSYFTPKYILKLLVLTIVIYSIVSFISNLLLKEQTTSETIIQTEQIKPEIPLEIQNTIVTEDPINTINIDTTKPNEEIIIPIDTKAIPDYSSNNSNSSPTDLTPEELLRLRKNQTETTQIDTNAIQKITPKNP